MAYFPVFIDIDGQTCLVAGGGRVALRKIVTLLEYGADVRVAAKEICPEICALIPESARRTGEVREEDFKGVVLVVAATADRKANRQIVDVCRRRSIPVNVVDDPDACSFLFPAVVKKGDISIGVNSGGKSPGVSARIRKQIEEVIPDSYGSINDQIGRLRSRVRESGMDEKDRRRILETAADRAFAAGKPLTEEEMEALLEDRRK